MWSDGYEAADGFIVHHHLVGCQLSFLSLLFAKLAPFLTHFDECCGTGSYGSNSQSS